MEKTKILFICIHNSARSQMAEAFVNSGFSDEFIAESAGLEPGELNPFAVEAMKEINIDISRNATKSVFDFFKEGRRYNYVITVCDEAAAQRCPIFPNALERINWSIPDPSTLNGTEEEIRKQIRDIRDLINFKVKELILQIKNKNND